MPTTELWPLFLYFLAIIVLVGLLLGLSWLLGERQRQRATAEPFESGVLPIGNARFRLSVQFYLIAVFFVIFDLEAVFLFAWAIALHDSGWTGYGEAVFFIAILAATLVYLWREGALDWAPDQRRERAQTHATRQTEEVSH